MQEAQPMWEVDKEPRRVLSLFNNSETRWCSTCAMLVRFYKLRISIQHYNEKAVQGLDGKSANVGNPYSRLSQDEINTHDDGENQKRVNPARGK